MKPHPSKTKARAIMAEYRAHRLYADMPHRELLDRLHEPGVESRDSYFNALMAEMNHRHIEDLQKSYVGHSVTLSRETFFKMLHRLARVPDAHLVMSAMVSATYRQDQETASRS